jgi:hypothetical protein
VPDRKLARGTRLVCLYGNAYSLPGTFTITGGTRVFAGASGSGTVTAYFAGDVEVAVFKGTITVP